MRILKVTQTYYPYLLKGGPPVKVRGIAKELVGRGHDVTILTADLGPPDSEEGAKHSHVRSGEATWTARDEAGEAVYLRTLASYRATTFNPQVISFCLKRLRNFDLVHIYGLYDLLGVVVAWFCQLWGIPYIVEPIGMLRPKIRSLRKKRAYRRLVGRALYEGAAYLIATSETERDELAQEGIPPEKIVLRRNGLDLSEFYSLPQPGAFRADLGISADEVLLLFLGRISFIKGLDLLVQAFSQVELPARLVIAGPNDEDGCFDRIRGLKEQLSLGDRVIHTGPIYHRQKLQALVDADLFVLPSRYESFGNAAAESIACGTPALITEECGIAALIQRSAGLSVPCSVEGLRDGLIRLIGDDDLRWSLREGCADVARRLSWQEPVSQTEKLYSSLRRKNSGHRASGLEVVAPTDQETL